MGFPVVKGLRAMELGSPGPVRERLNGLVLSGPKTATAGTLDDYEDEPYEFVGERLALVDDDLRPVGVVEVTDTVLTTFGAVPWSFARAENEGDASIEEWREGHRRFWEGTGVAVTEELPIILIHFRPVGASASGLPSSTD
jgi:uncharacterized protein YhfF